MSDKKNEMVLFPKMKASFDIGAKKADKHYVKFMEILIIEDTDLRLEKLEEFRQKKFWYKRNNKNYYQWLASHLMDLLEDQKEHLRKWQLELRIDSYKE